MAMVVHDPPIDAVWRLPRPPLMQTKNAARIYREFASKLAPAYKVRSGTPVDSSVSSSFY